MTARDAVAERVTGLEAGADDYLVKPFASEELVARLQALLRRNRPQSTRLTFRDVALDLDTREATRGGRGLGLTAREADLLLSRHGRSAQHLHDPPQRVHHRLDLARVPSFDAALSHMTGSYRTHT